ncbi:uncharacterized protein TNCV_5111451 [Trichonephila clavipes]|nr:uncharacterized protein TNCV_5111451 [Trichonephila clavipes]
MKWVCLRRWSSGSRGVLRARDASGQLTLFLLVESEFDRGIENFESFVQYNFILCCPVCFERKVSVVQDSVFGLALNMTLKCENCDYSFSFCTSEKVNKLHSINLAFVFGMRIIGKGHSAAKKLCSAINIDVPSKRAFGFLEKKLEFAASNVACNTMKEAALEIRSNETNTELFSQCGVSVDGT